MAFSSPLPQIQMQASSVEELKILKEVDQGSALFAVTREFEIGKTTVTDIMDASEVIRLLQVEAQGCILLLEKE